MLCGFWGCERVFPVLSSGYYSSSAPSYRGDHSKLPSWAGSNVLRCCWNADAFKTGAPKRFPTAIYWWTSHHLLFILQRDCDIGLWVCQAPDKHKLGKTIGLLQHHLQWHPQAKAAAIQTNKTVKQHRSRAAQIQWPILGHIALSLCHKHPFPPGPSSMLGHKVAFPSLTSPARCLLHPQKRGCYGLPAPCWLYAS